MTNNQLNNTSETEDKADSALNPEILNNLASVASVWGVDKRPAVIYLYQIR